MNRKELHDNSPEDGPRHFSPYAVRMGDSLMGRKTFMGGALNMGLVASNTDQLLIVVTSKPDLDALDITKIVLISISLFVQVNIIICLQLLNHIDSLSQLFYHLKMWVSNLFSGNHDVHSRVDWNIKTHNNIFRKFKQGACSSLKISQT